MKIRILNNSIRLFFSKRDVELVKNKQSRDSFNMSHHVNGISYGLEFVDKRNMGAVFSGTEMKFCLSKEKTLQWLKSEGRKMSQILPVGKDASLNLVLEKTDEALSVFYKLPPKRIQMF